MVGRYRKIRAARSCPYYVGVRFKLATTTIRCIARDIRRENAQCHLLKSSVASFSRCGTCEMHIILRLRPRCKSASCRALCLKHRGNGGKTAIVTADFPPTKIPPELTRENFHDPHFPLRESHCSLKFTPFSFVARITSNRSRAEHEPTNPILSMRASDQEERSFFSFNKWRRSVKNLHNPIFLFFCSLKTTLISS